MIKLHINFRDGFHYDQAVVRINGLEVERRSDLTTNLAISFAAAMDIDAPDAPCTLSLDLPHRGLSATLELDPSSTPFAEASITEGQIALRSLKEPIPIL